MIHLLCVAQIARLVLPLFSFVFICIIELRECGLCGKGVVIWQDTWACTTSELNEIVHQTIISLSRYAHVM